MWASSILFDISFDFSYYLYLFISSAVDEGSQQKYAIKKIANVFENTEDAKRILREIILMRRFDHENIVKMVDLIPPPPNATSFDDIYIVQVANENC